MKKIIALIAFISICYMAFADGGYTYTNRYTNRVVVDSTTSLILQLDFESFRGKPIDSFLVKLPQNYSSIHKFFAGAKVPGGLLIEYANGNYVRIYMQHPLCCISNPHAMPSQWNLNELKMEKAADITLNDGINCLKGCHPDKEYD